MKKDLFRQGVVVLCTLASLAVIYLINAGLTSLKSVSEIAGEGEWGGEGQSPNLTLPASYAFGIWGPIYLGFLGYALYQARPSRRGNPHFRRTGYPVALSILLNLVWTLLVGYERTNGAYLVQWGMLGVALVLVRRWGDPVAAESRPPQWLKLPFSLYAGWLTVAMIPFTTSLLQDAGWRGGPLSPAAWAAGLYLAAAGIAYLTSRYLREPWYLLSVAWALLGIAVRVPGPLALLAGNLSVLVLVRMVGQLRGFGAVAPEPIALQ
jgi:hypothetical protein